MEELSNLNIKLPQDKRQNLNSLAREKGVSVAGLVRMAIYEMLEKEIEKKAA